MRVYTSCACVGNEEGEPVIEERKIRIETVSFGASAQNSDDSEAESAGVWATDT